MWKWLVGIPMSICGIRRWDYTKWNAIMIQNYIQWNRHVSCCCVQRTININWILHWWALCFDCRWIRASVKCYQIGSRIRQTFHWKFGRPSWRCDMLCQGPQQFIISDQRCVRRWNQRMGSANAEMPPIVCGARRLCARHLLCAHRSIERKTVFNLWRWQNDKTLEECRGRCTRHTRRRTSIDCAEPNDIDDHQSQSCAAHIRHIRWGLLNLGAFTQRTIEHIQMGCGHIACNCVQSHRDDIVGCLCQRS